MKIESVNVGAVRTVEWHGQTFTTGIFKDPVAGPVRVEGVSLRGDEQADLSAHGGPTRSVYAYPGEHYEVWRTELSVEQGAVLENFGAFGENLTTRGLLEPDAGIGDRFRVGSAILQVTEPRMPCSKLGMRFDDAEFVKRFYGAGRNGIYFAIVEPGEIRAGDDIERIGQHDSSLTIHDVVELHTGRSRDDALRRIASEHPGLSEEWRAKFR